MNLLNFVTCLLAFDLAGNAFVNGQGCTFILPGDIPKGTDPLMFVYDGDNLKYAVPKMLGSRGAIQLNKSQGLLVSCPGGGNYVRAIGQQSLTATCMFNKTLSVNNKEYSINQLNCNHKTESNVQDTGKRCANGKGTLVEIGYNADKIGWRTLAETCHDLNGAFSYYTKHTLYGTAIGSRIPAHGRPKFRPGGNEFYKGIDPQNAYSQPHQQSIMEGIVGAENIGKYFQPKKNVFMAKGHLAPDGDFLFDSWQAASFYFINAAPQWQTINGGNWARVEGNARAFAKRASVDLDVVTGTYGIMELFGKQIYLAGSERLPAPDLYWKILRRPSDNACIAFVSTNNPFLEAPPKHICPDICAKYGWPVIQSDLKKGYVYCCDYRSIKAAIDYIPEMNCRSVIGH